MNINKYNTRVRQAISDEYVKCSKKIAELRKEEATIYLQIKKRREEDSLLLSEYLRLEQRKAELQEDINELAIELNVWNKAREICLDIADEC